MSAPTRGMVAGQPIKTGELTKEYEDGHARIFGDRKPVRGRFVWDAELGEMVEVGGDWEPTDRPGAPRRSEAEIYGNDVAQDGSDISSRRKRAEYMKREGVADASDYTNTWAKAKKEREAFLRGEVTPAQRERTRHQVAETMERLRAGHKPPDTRRTWLDDD